MAEVEMRQGREQEPGRLEGARPAGVVPAPDGGWASWLRTEVRDEFLLALRVRPGAAAELKVAAADYAGWADVKSLSDVATHLEVLEARYPDLGLGIPVLRARLISHAGAVVADRAVEAVQKGDERRAAELISSFLDLEGRYLRGELPARLLAPELRQVLQGVRL